MDIKEMLREQIALFDGAMGTELQKAGIIYDCPERLNLDNPDAVLKVHKDYLAAGAQVLTANTFGANCIKLSKFSLQDKVCQINKKAVAIAKQASNDEALVALSLGPSGELLSPLGSVDFCELLDVYAQQIKCGEDADILLFETFSCLAEARICALAARETSDKPIILSFSFGKDGKTIMGNPPESCAILAERLNLTAVGINCSTPQDALPMLESMRKYCSVPIIVQPNAGVPKLTDGKPIYPLDAEDMDEKMLPILQSGASAIGGCCGTDAHYIEVMARITAYMRPPEAINYNENFIASQREFVSLREALSSCLEISVKECDNPYEVLSSAYDLSDKKALFLDLSELSYEKIKALIPQAQNISVKPFMFRVKTRSQAESALRHYSGIAALYAPENVNCADIAYKYGAYII